MIKAVTEPMEKNEKIGEMLSWFRENVVGYSSDGANTMIGEGRGVLGRLRNFVGDRNIFAIHCIAHRLELVLRDAVDPNSKMKVMDAAFAYLDKQHHKGGGTFDAYRRFAENMGITHVKRVRAISGTRWAAKVTTALRTVISDFRPLRAWYVGNKNPSQLQYLFTEGVYWLYACYELFNAVSELSLYVQRERSSALSISSRVENLDTNLQRIMLQSFTPKMFRVAGSQVTVENFDGVKETFSVNSVELEVARTEFSVYATNVLLAFRQRFPEDQRQLWRNLAVFDLQSWPVDFPNENFGNEGVRQVAKYVEEKSIPVDWSTDDSSFVQRAIADWTTFKHLLRTKINNYEFVRKLEPLKFWEAVLGGDERQTLGTNFTCPITGTALAKVIECVLVLPLSSAENERIGAALKRVSKRSATIQERLQNSLLFIQLNGPPIKDFEALHYGKSWINRPQQHTTRQTIQDMVIEQDFENEELYTDAII